MTFNINNLLKAEAYEHDTDNIELIETHISWVVLTGRYAYKIKKPVNFGFLDFSTLEKRQQYCEQEIILNRRLAPAIYLETVAILGTTDKPHISDKELSDSDEVLEYAVKMLQFPQSAQLDNMLASGDLKTEHMDAIAMKIANFHQSAAIADETLAYGNTENVEQPVAENFTQIDEHLDPQLSSDEVKKSLDKLLRWSRQTFSNIKPVLSQRKADGFIRQCHGDMHLRNMIWLNHEAMAFDCIEFNAELSWIDVISEVAFLVMDLQDRHQDYLANHFLNRYLEHTGDYAGLAVMPYYLCYRALVRAKVDTLRLQQKNIPAEEQQKTFAEFESYLQLASRYTQRANPKLIIMRGLSASGKSTVSQQLVDGLGVIRIRSDVERKRLFMVNLSSTTFTGAELKSDMASDRASEIDKGMYSAQASQQTYERLLELATQIISAGYSVIVDAAFLKPQQRKPFQQLAEDLSERYIILEITAPADILRQRIKMRKNDVSDADLSVLEHQLSNWQPLEENEKTAAIRVDTSERLEIETLLDKIKIATY